MFEWLFGKKSKGSRLGIDLGSSSIKVIELEKREGRTFLSNYALVREKPTAVFKIGDLKEAETAEILRSLLDRAGIGSRRASISLPLEKTFSTVVELPYMPEEEIGAAISFEAQKYVPVPLEEVVLDWSVIPKNDELANGQRDDAGKMNLDGAQISANRLPAQNIQILLIAVPKDVINRTMEIARLADVQVLALEQEAFSLVRSLVGNDKNPFLILDLGRRNTNLIVVDQGFIRMTHNIEALNKEFILLELERIVSIFEMKYNRKITQCLFSGGRAGEEEMINFLISKLKMPGRVGDPFARITSEPVLAPVLKELSPQFSIAAGLAMRE